MEFGFVDEAVWRFQATVFGVRWNRLWVTPFEEIVSELVANVSIETLRRAEPNKAHPGLMRLSLLLSAPPHVVDLFHNGRGGYRAQYLRSVTNGDAANAYAFMRVLDRLADQRNGNFGRSRSHVFAGARAHGGKLWIKEGRWSRAPRRELVVPLWQERRPMDDVEMKDTRRKVRYGAAAPDHETRLVLKGEWVDVDGNPPAKPMKRRGEQIHLYGFT